MAAAPDKGEEVSMKHTEKEAKMKMCCGPYVVACMMEGSNLKCIASECMAWRWMPKDEDTPMNHDAEWVLSGYCGLATRPEEA